MSQHESDPVGNALSRAFTLLAMILLWILLAILMLIAGGAGEMRRWSKFIAVALVPFSGFASGVAIEQMGRDRQLKWPVLLPAVMPVLLIAYAIWCYSSWLHARVDAATAGAAVWGTILLLSPLAWIAKLARQRAVDAIPRKTPEELAEEAAMQEQQTRQQRRDAFNALSADSEFSKWWEFIGDLEFSKRAYEGARLAKSRDQEFPALLTPGNRKMFLAIPEMNLTLTPELQQAVGAFLTDQVQNLRRYDPANPMETTVVTEWFEQYFPVFKWLAERQAQLDAEFMAIEAAVCKYPDCPERQQFLEALKTFKSHGLQ